MKLGPLSGYAEPGIGWVRIFGFGFHWKDTTRHHLFFSERNGYRRVYRVGKWALSPLRRGE